MTRTNHTVRVGVVGCGVVASAYYLPCLMAMDSVELIAVCDRVAARAENCARLFGARSYFLDYDEMLAQADLDAVFVLTAPGTHVPFALKALEAGKHLLLQKPMATDMVGAQAIAHAVRQAGVKAVIEPSAGSPLDPDVALLRDLVRRGALGEVQWFTLAATGPTSYGPSLGNNPYGQQAFYTKDSGGFLFDFPYGPMQIVGVLGPCTSVLASARTSSMESLIVPEAQYDAFLAKATDPLHANYWDVVLDLARTERVRMETYDNVYSLYELANGAIGACHVGRTHHPTLPGAGSGSLQIFGTDGNLICGAGYRASIISQHTELLPEVDADGWFHIPERGDTRRAKWPHPTPGAFNYYHESTRHLIACILEDREPLINVDWGLHITEMMVGAAESVASGTRYSMTTTLDY
jgi:predicted dehydrogenase